MSARVSTGRFAFGRGALVALLLAACSGSTRIIPNGVGGDAGAEGGAGGAAITVDQACGDDARAACLKMQSCTPATLQETYGNEAICEVRLKSNCLDAHAAPSSGAQPVRTEDCAQTYAGYSCADYRNRANIPLDCQQVSGSSTDGSPCEYAGQCQSAFCAIVPGNPCGACATPPGPGDGCAALTSCGDNLTCTTDTLTCVTPAALGADCGSGVPCGAGLSCVAPGGLGSPGTCQAAGAQVGVPCDGAMKAAPGCDTAFSLYCDGLTKLCAQITYAGAGQPCGYDATTGLSFGCTSGSCVGAGGGQMGRCVARSADGEPCAVPDGGASTPVAGCLPAARCVVLDGAAPTCEAVAAASCR